MQTILQYFRVKKIIRYHGTMQQLEGILEAMEKKRLDKEEFHINKIDKHQYLLNPTISIGTMQTSVNGMIVHTDEITVKMNLHNRSANLQEIEMFGSLHKAHLLIFFAFLIVVIGSVYTLVSYGQFTGLILVAILWPIFHLWFNFVWTSQEKDLIEEVKLALHIRIRAGIGI